MKTPTLYYAHPAEQRAVAWLKRQRHREGAAGYALQEVAYDPAHSRTNWGNPGISGFAMAPIPRATWVAWRHRPYGHAEMNRLHQWALRCIRRNIYFPEIARKIGKRDWM